MILNVGFRKENLKCWTVLTLYILHFIRRRVYETEGQHHRGSIRIARQEEVHPAVHTQVGARQRACQSGS
jgi:hypothetical protein